MVSNETSYMPPESVVRMVKQEFRGGQFAGANVSFGEPAI